MCVYSRGLCSGDGFSGDGTLFFRHSATAVAFSLANYNFQMVNSTLTAHKDWPEPSGTGTPQSLTQMLVWKLFYTLCFNTVKTKRHSQPRSSG